MFEFFWTRKTSLWISIFYIILGIPLLFAPAQCLTLFKWLLFGGSIVYGIVRLLRYYQGQKDGYAQTSDKTLGILFLALGIFFLSFYNIIFSFLSLVLGILLLADGIGKIPVLISAKQESSIVVKPLIFSTVVPLILGIILIMNPFGLPKFVLMFFGVSLILDGAVDLYTVFYTRSHLPKD